MSSQAQLAMMDSFGRVPPIQATYSDLLSVSFPAKKQQVEMTSSNGDLYDLVGKNTIEIPIAVGTGQWVDLSNSYLKLTVKNNATGNSIGYKTSHDLIERLQILGTNSEIIEDIQNYNNLSRMLVSHQYGEDGWNYNTNLGEWQTSTLHNSTAVASNSKTDIDTGLSVILGTANAVGQGSHFGQPFTTTLLNNTSKTICFPLISGVMSCGKYLPLGMLKNRSLTLRIQLARGTKAFTSSADTVPKAEISDVAFVCDVITMSSSYNEKFMNMIQSVGDISIHYTTYKNYQDSASSSANATQTVNMLIPDSSRSLKSLFTIFNTQAETNQTDALQLINPQLTSYQYQILSETYPQKQIQNVSATNRNQAFANLHIALGNLGSVSSRCIAPAEAYYNSGTSAQINTNSSTFAIGVCAESHNKSSNLLESGVNLSNSTQPCRLTAQIQNTNALNIQVYSLSDRLIMIDSEGNLRSSG